MKHVFVAGATGYLGRFLCAEYRKRGWHVTALIRKSGKTDGLEADRLIEAEATWPESLVGAMEDIDLVVSALGITRQTDGLTYWDVDYQANLNLLEEARRSGVSRFAYVHVLNADRMDAVPLVAAKSAFVRKLQSSDVASTVIAPTGYFSDMADFLTMAQSGRVWLFGSGEPRINPIHGADLAAAIFEAAEAGVDWQTVGGPETFTQTDLAHLCFDVLGKDHRITYLPDWVRRLILRVLPRLAPGRIAGPAQFFLTASGMNMTAPPTGEHRLADFFQSLENEKR
ncbi:SDR family oxidoreductase [Pacificoceanicola onchidii]|uniref:SDR family oxidoreductase n=1 Tax=Pacificoceanicola onchidii TaxID=2562685 RepID=UPI0010A5D8D7|nr:SDR family oxidoreductase [Pacificoceanicola onchidii]